MTKASFIPGSNDMDTLLAYFAKHGCLRPGSRSGTFVIRDKRSSKVVRRWDIDKEYYFHRHVLGRSLTSVIRPGRSVSLPRLLSS